MQAAWYYSGMELPKLSLVTRQDYLRALELIVKDQRCSRWYIQKKAKDAWKKALEIVSAFIAAGFITEQPNGRFIVNATWADVDQLSKAFREADETEEAEDRAKQALWDTRDDKGLLIQQHNNAPDYRSTMPFNEPAFAEVLDRIAQGETLAGVLSEASHLPSMSCFTKWLEDHPDAELHRRRFYVRRLARADMLVQQVIDIASDSSDDLKVIRLPGNVESVVTNTENVQRSKLKIETIKWAIQKSWPEWFSDNLDNHHIRDQLLRPETPTFNIQNLTALARDKLVAFLEQVEADKAAGLMLV